SPLFLRSTHTTSALRATGNGLSSSCPASRKTSGGPSARAGRKITMLTWKTVDPSAIYPLERYHAVSGNHEYRIFYGLKAASQDRPWVLVIREVGTACTRMCTAAPHPKLFVPPASRSWGAG